MFTDVETNRSTYYRALLALLLWLPVWVGGQKDIEMPKLRVRRSVGHAGAGNIGPQWMGHQHPALPAP
jgi:hypothetical protein